MAAPRYVPTASVWRLQFLHIFHIAYICAFIIAILVGVKYVAGILIFISLVANVELLCMFIGHLYIFFGERSIQVLCPFLIEKG